MWVEWYAAILRILRVTTGNGNLVSLPVDVPILNPQHLAPARFDSQARFDTICSRAHSSVPALPTAGLRQKTQRVRLRRSERSVQVMRDYPTLEEWKAKADAILKRLGPKPSGERR